MYILWHYLRDKIWPKNLYRLVEIMMSPIQALVHSVQTLDIDASEFFSLKRLWLRFTDNLLLWCPLVNLIFTTCGIILSFIGEDAEVNRSKETGVRITKPVRGRAVGSASVVLSLNPVLFLPVKIVEGSWLDFSYFNQLLRGSRIKWRLLLFKNNTVAAQTSLGILVWTLKVIKKYGLFSATTLAKECIWESGCHQ